MVTFLIVLFGPTDNIRLATPVFRHLKQQVEEPRILFLTVELYASLLDANPNIDKIYSYSGDFKSCIQSLKTEEIDYIIDLQRNTLSARLKFRLKRMDFTVRRMSRKKELPGPHITDLYMECIRHFLDEKDELGPDN